jgi:hypothetical protein
LTIEIEVALSSWHTVYIALWYAFDGFELILMALDVRGGRL